MTEEPLKVKPTGFQHAPPQPNVHASRVLLKARLKEFWNAQEVYWSSLQEENDANSDVRAHVASFIPKGGRILDVACGCGANCASLLERGKYFGTDISQSGLRRVRSADLHLSCADVEFLPFADGSFDAAISTYSLEHSVNPAQMLAEIARVTRRGGRIVLLGPTWDFPFWYPNSLLSRARNPLWRAGYTLKRLATQIAALLGGPSPFLIVEEPDAFSEPFIHDSDAVYVVWSYEVIREMRRCGCTLLHASVDTPLLGTKSFSRWAKGTLRWLPAYRHAGSTALLVFEKSSSLT